MSFENNPAIRPSIDRSSKNGFGIASSMAENFELLQQKSAKSRGLVPGSLDNVGSNNSSDSNLAFSSPLYSPQETLTSFKTGEDAPIDIGMVADKVDPDIYEGGTTSAGGDANNAGGVDILLEIHQRQDAKVNESLAEKALREVLESNPLFREWMQNTGMSYNEMLESIKSDPFLNALNNENFDKAARDKFEIFNGLRDTSADSIVNHGMDPVASKALTDIRSNNTYNDALANFFTDQVRFNPQVQSIINNDDLNGREKLRDVMAASAGAVREQMAAFGAVTEGGKLVPGQLDSKGIVLVFGGNEAAAEFARSGGILSQLADKSEGAPYKMINHNRQFMFVNTEDSELGRKLAESLGVEPSSGSGYNAAVISAKGTEIIAGKDENGVVDFNIDSIQQKIENATQDWVDMNKERSEHSLTDQFQILENVKEKPLDIKGKLLLNESASMFAEGILEKFMSNEYLSLEKDNLALAKDSLASLFQNGMSTVFDRAQKSGFNHNPNSVEDTLGKYSDVDAVLIRDLQKSLSGHGIEIDAQSTAVLLQAGITEAGQIGQKEKDIMKDYQTASNLQGSNNKAWYESKLEEYITKGYLPEYVRDYKEQAEAIMNIPADSRGYFDGGNALNTLASIATIAHILKHPETAFNKDAGDSPENKTQMGEGFYARLVIANDKDHNGAFGMNSGNRYVRGEHEAAMSLLDFGKIGSVSIYGGNGMTDKEFSYRLNRLLRTNTTEDGYNMHGRGVLTSENDTNEVRGLGLVHVSEEGHGSRYGNYGVNGGMDSGDKERFKIYAGLVKGASFSLNCVACSNLGGENSYGHTVLNEMSEYLPNYVRLIATGAEVPTPPSRDRLTHLKGHIAPGLVTNSDRIIFAQGKLEPKPEDLLKLSKFAMDQYNLYRAIDKFKPDQGTPSSFIPTVPDVPTDNKRFKAEKPWEIDRYTNNENRRPTNPVLTDLQQTRVDSSSARDGIVSIGSPSKADGAWEQAKASPPTTDTTKDDKTDDKKPDNDIVSIG